MKPLAPHSDVEAEVDDAMAYYERRRSGLGLEFQDELAIAFERIRSGPRRHPRDGNTAFRKCFLKRFPYTVYFQEFDDYIWIAAVSHQKRKPGYWSSRTPEDG